MEKIDLKKISINDLMEYEKACNVIFKYYENNIKNYDGSVNTNSYEYKILQEFNNIRIKIIEELSTRLKNIKL